MNHAEIISLMDLFLTDSLSPFETWNVLKHLKTCTKCIEELEVRLLVGMTAGTVNTRDSFDLKRSLQDIMEKRRKKVKTFFILILLSAFVLAAAVIALIMFLR